MVLKTKCQATNLETELWTLDDQGSEVDCGLLVSFSRECTLEKTLDLHSNPQRIHEQCPAIGLVGEFCYKETSVPASEGRAPRGLCLKDSSKYFYSTYHELSSGLGFPQQQKLAIS